MSDLANSSCNPTRTWCILASEAPVAAVIVRHYGTGFTHILKWQFEERAVEPGAWTRMTVKPLRCHVSPDGQFFSYRAAGGLGGPFPADQGGGTAVSRLPWLSALTKIDAWWRGVFPSDHELSESDQQRLVNTFRDAKPYHKAEDWPDHLGSGWKRVSAYAFDEVLSRASTTRSESRLAAELPIQGTGCLLVSLLDRKHKDRDENDEPVFFVRSITTRAPYSASDVIPLPECWWAAAAPSGSILLASKSGRLMSLRVADSDKSQPPWVVEQDHDLTMYSPSPGPSPESARAPLDSDDRLP